MVVNAGLVRALRAAPWIAAAVSILLLAGAGARALKRRSSNEVLREQLAEVESNLQRLEKAEAISLELERDESLISGQHLELDTIVPPGDSPVATKLRRDLWEVGFAPTSVTLLRSVEGEDGVEVRFMVAAHSGANTWLDALVGLESLPRIYAVEAIRVVDPADPDARAEFEVVTWTQRRSSGAGARDLRR